MKYEILQLSKGHIREYGFEGYEDALKLGFNLEHYEKVYEGEIQGSMERKEQILEELYEKFNINHPTDFRGHSMSVSDIVILEGHKFYCDCFGFTKLD